MAAWQNLGLALAELIRQQLHQLHTLCPLLPSSVPSTVVLWKFVDSGATITVKEISLNLPAIIAIAKMLGQ